MNERLIALLLDSFPKILLPGLTMTIPLTVISFSIAMVIATWAPWTDHDENDQLVGFDVEVAQGVAAKLGATAMGVDTLDETLAMVLSGRADATLNAEVSFYDYMNVHPDANLKVVALTDEASQVAMPIRKEADSASLLTAVNQAIDELRAEGELTRISEKYFGKDITAGE